MKTKILLLTILSMLIASVSFASAPTEKQTSLSKKLMQTYLSEYLFNPNSYVEGDWSIAVLDDGDILCSHSFRSTNRYGAVTKHVTSIIYTKNHGSESIGPKLSDGTEKSWGFYETDFYSIIKKVPDRYEEFKPLTLGGKEL